MVDVAKHYGGGVPLRIRRLTVSKTDRITLGGLDAAAAEMLVHLMTGASVPDEGTIRVAGTDTRAIRTDTEWLASLDRFGIVTGRAVLISPLPVAANLALPLTLAIDPMTDETRSAVEALARLVGLPGPRLGDVTASLTPAELVRVHLARALALKPELLILEHPTAAIHDDSMSRELGAALRSAADHSTVGWLAITDDREFGRASGGASMRLQSTTGEVRPDSFWRRLMT
jgi:predicted ABC-type transport system involved in lysophospholipase L1 biosynthesis ATPase subunit